eukprot:9703985-Heterocapsa_arctica.AAC.1
MGWHIVGRKALANFWVCSGSNTADDPSRFNAVRRPAPCPAWLAQHMIEQPSAEQQTKHRSQPVRKTEHKSLSGRL